MLTSIKEHRKEKVDSVYQINWDDNEALGSGATSTVRIAINKTTQEKYALKTIELHRLPPHIIQSLFEEVNIMRVLDHPNIIKIVETFVDYKRLYIIMECCTGGELFDLLYDQEGAKFQEKDALNLAIKMCSALNYLHENKIIHRDLTRKFYFYKERS